MQQVENRRESFVMIVVPMREDDLGDDLLWWRVGRLELLPERLFEQRRILILPFSRIEEDVGWSSSDEVGIGTCNGIL